MDWKDLLASKVEDGTLSREEFVPQQEPSAGKAADILHVSIDRKGRKGKTATLIEGFTCSEEEVQEVAAALKTRLGAGGSSRGSEILIQGDALEKVKRLLVTMGYRVK